MKRSSAFALVKQKVTRKSMTEMGFAEPNKAGIRPQTGARGRPTLYNEQTMPYQAYLMCAHHGATFKELGELWGVSEGTVGTWIKEHGGFALAVRNGKDAFNAIQIEGSLVKRALGFEYEEVSIKEIMYKVKGPDGTSIVPAQEVIKTRKLIVPDVAAIIFYLKNRASDRWRDRMPEFSASKEIEGTRYTLSGMQTDDLKSVREAVRMAMPKRELTN